MFRWLFSPALFLSLAAFPCAAQSPATGTTADDNTAPATPNVSGATTSSGSNTAAATPKKVWTNDNLKDANGSVSVVGEKGNQKYAVPLTKTADPATVAKIRQSLEKLQKQLDDVNKQLSAYKQFQDGEAVSDGGRDVSKGYSRTPVNQQMAKLQDKKKELQIQIGELVDEARKKGIEPGQLR
jgi:hypothetical protein